MPKRTETPPRRELARSATHPEPRGHRGAERRYVALLRGVSPTNCKMPELKRCLEEAGYANVRTVLASGNAVFTGPERPEHELESRLQQLLATRLTRSFPVIVRPLASIQQLLTTDPFRDFQLAPTAKRVVTFLRELPGPGLSLPIEFEGARILRVREREVFTAYVPHPSGPVFMTLIEKTFGKDVTTRTWDTVQKLTRGEPAR